MPINISALLGGQKGTKPLDLRKAGRQIGKLENEASEMMTRLDIPLVVVDESRVKMLARSLKKRLKAVLA